VSGLLLVKRAHKKQSVRFLHRGVYTCILLLFSLACVYPGNCSHNLRVMMTSLHMFLLLLFYDFLIVILNQFVSYTKGEYMFKTRAQESGSSAKCNCPCGFKSCGGLFLAQL